MSKIKELIQARINELAMMELEEEIMAARTPEMTSISIRVSKDSLKKIDLIAEKLQLSRSDIARSFLDAGTAEAFQSLEIPVSEVVDFLERAEQEEIDRSIAEQEEIDRLMKEGNSNG